MAQHPEFSNFCQWLDLELSSLHLNNLSTRDYSHFAHFVSEAEDVLQTVSGNDAYDFSLFASESIPYLCKNLDAFHHEELVHTVPFFAQFFAEEEDLKEAFERSILTSAPLFSGR